MKFQADPLDDLEVERSNRRSKEFESRFNRANYQLERDMRALNKISKTCGDFIGNLNTIYLPINKSIY